MLQNEVFPFSAENLKNEVFEGSGEISAAVEKEGEERERKVGGGVAVSKLW